MLDWIELCDPCPIATIAITEAMPITIPSIVRLVRTLFTVTALYVSSQRSLVVMLF
jgi:hypothetical protein